MRPESRKETSKSAVAARAKALLGANLGWLEGFPLEVADGSVRWMAVPAAAPAREMSLDGSHLSRATYTLNKLKVELAPALERLAGDPGEWMASVERRLERLKGAIHRGDRLSQRFFEDEVFPRSFRERAARLVDGEPRLKPVVNALAWVSAGHPERARAALDAIAAIAEGGSGYEPLAARLGEVPARVALLRLAQLAEIHGLDKVRALASCVLDEHAYGLVLGGGPEFCCQVLTGLSRHPKAPLPEALPKGAALGTALARWCEEIVQQNRRTQRLALRLLELADPMPLVKRWAPWWDEVRGLLREAQALAGLRYDRESRHELRERIDRLRVSPPPTFFIEWLIKALDQASVPEASPRTALLLRALERVPAEADAPSRAHLALYWSSLGDDGPEARVDLLLAGFERYLAHLNRQSPKPSWEAALAPWSDAVSSPWTSYDKPEFEFLSQNSPRRTVLAAYEHLASIVARHGKITPRAAGKAIDLFLLADGDSDLAAKFFASAVALGEFRYYHLSSPFARLAVRLCRESPESFAVVLAGLTAQEEREGLQPGDWPEAVLGPLSAGRIGAFVREAVATRQLGPLLACGTKSVLLEAAGIQPLPLPVLGEPMTPDWPPDWAGRYPPELQPSLHRLAAVLDDAEARVARWLAGDLPETGRLEREIRALEERLPQADPERQPSLQTRLANLRARLSQPVSLSAARLERLRARLDRAWGRAVLDRWQNDLDAHLPGALRSLLGIQDAPPWLFELEPLSLLAAATRLPEAHRRLACRLFRVRCGPPPWDLRDAPQNRRFVESLPHLDWQPWIDGIGTVTVEAANGRRLHLALEDDPLEIFQMGERFQTCLSPGAQNYFSVFANAADVNKRVLYARGDDGKAVGRCLLALTERGELLTFAPYCHDGTLKFGELCADFAGQLARRMGAPRVPRGRVPVLVASRWYDDGPRDLSRLYVSLEEGSPLRRRLAAVRPGELLEELPRGLKPARLDETTLPMVLALSEIQQRPELAVPLLRLAAECRVLPDDALVTVAHLAAEAGSAELVRRLLLQRLVDRQRRFYQNVAQHDPRATNLLLRLDPGRLLTLLRQTRQKSCRDWDDEIYGVRLEDAARALETLCRPRQALAVWRRLATSTAIWAEPDARERAREAVARLEN